MKKRKTTWLKIVATLLVAVTGLFLLQRLLMPKYVDGVVEGALVGEYYQQEDKNFDVIFVGDCEV